jgi:DNA-directed RNA polymerase specialized sigma24 family protein
VTATHLSAKEYSFYRMKAYFIAKGLGPGCSIDELIGWGMVSLAKSLKSYIPEGKMSLHSYVVQHMKWDMLDALRVTRLESRLDVKKGIFYRETSLDEAGDLARPEEVDTDKIDLMRSIELLPLKRRNYIKAYLRHDDDGEAAKEAGISLDCGYQHHCQAVRTLREIMLAP